MNRTRALATTRKWAGLLTSTGAWQAAIAAVGFASGILVVRLLDVEQYALYTIAVSLLGAMTVLGDSGLSSGVMARGGAVWQDRGRLGGVLATALHLSRRFAIIAAVLAIPAGLFLLGKHGASVGVSLLISLLLIPCFSTAIRNNLLQIPLRLHQDLRPLQLIQLCSNTGRLLVLGGLLWIAPYAASALVGAVVAMALSNAGFAHASKRYADPAADSDPRVRSAILQIVWRTLPGSTYYCVSGQLMVWLISLFGNTDSVAQLGALGRLAMITSVVSAVATTLVVPRFARLPNHRSLLLLRAAVIAAAIVVVGGVGILVAAWVPEPFLWILGSDYTHLERELILVAIASALSLATGIIVALNFSRGLVPYPAFNVFYSIVTQTLFIAINDVSRLDGVLLMSIGTAASQLLFNAIYLVLKVGKSPTQV